MRGLAIVITLTLAACAAPAHQEPSPPPGQSNLPPSPTQAGQLTSPLPAPTTASALATSALPASVTPITVHTTLPHDSHAFTQGLEFYQGRLFESRGLFGESAITEINPTTGVVINRVDLDPNDFGEGLTVVDDEIVQLTWKNQKAYRWTLDLQPKGTYTYTGEGWGLCWDGGRFVMSDGSSTLTFRDRDFNPINTVAVHDNGQPIDQLNELECAHGKVYANIWHHNQIVVIDPSTGAVDHRLDVTPHIPEGLGPEQVLNGIAKHPTDGWLLTGKQWPVMLTTPLATHE